MILFIKTLYFTLQEFLISKVTLIRPVRINICTGYLCITLQYSSEEYDILDSVVTLKTYIEPFSDLKEREREREREGIIPYKHSTTVSPAYITKGAGFELITLVVISAGFRTNEALC